MSKWKAFSIILIIAAVFFTGCATSGKFFPEKPVQKIPYVIVYVKEGCSLCRDLKQGLDQAGLAYVSRDISEEPIRDEVASRLDRAGLAADRIAIPVVDVNGSLAVRPSVRDVIGLYSCSHAGAGKSPAGPEVPACSDALSSCKECAG